MKKLSMQDVMKANKAAGWHFFDKDTMSFFGSKIETDLYPNDMFVTSEDDFFGEKRYYSVRKFDRETSEILDIGKFQAYKTKAEAIAVINQLL